MRNLIATYVKSFFYAGNRDGEQAANHYINVLRNGSSGSLYTFTLVLDYRNGDAYYYIYSEPVSRECCHVCKSVQTGDCMDANCGWCH